jgi:putative ATPase
VYLASAPKSNRSYLALNQALRDVQQQPRGEVPLHLRDAHYKGAASLGHGEGYDYPHDDPRGWVEQDYRPPGLQGRRYYEPSTHGAERRVAERLAQQSRPEEVADDGE